MTTFYLIAGFLIILIAAYDFFYTTLSGSGAFVISKSTFFLLHKTQLWLSRVFGRSIFSISGLLVNLSLLVLWTLLVWAGLFLVFTSDPDAIVNSSDRVATGVERLYFTGYVLSTLGIGNFIPTTPFFELLTSVFSLYGFVFFTTAMTYLISVTSAVNHKRSLALAIRDFGNSPEKLMAVLATDNNPIKHQQIIELKGMVERHTINHQSYPVLHYYANPDKDSSFSINFTILDESVNILMISQESDPIHQELYPLKNALDNYLMHIRNKYGQSSEPGLHPRVNLDNFEFKNLAIHPKDVDQESLVDRRRVLTSLLKNEGYEWQDVYAEKKLA